MAVRAVLGNTDEAVGEISRLREVGFLVDQRVFWVWIKCRCYEDMAKYFLCDLKI